ncbi:prepilin peptidase [Halomonas campisalis]|uniref:Prepilin peptidase n=1 Tax=Billgrantia campisalis TaxID=74661 RepID=A0ABS9P6B9_9GAMM|nr:A24 family peptidase [Halomonas campisalis]MCG6657317.1 prepilin peptidase [Halomonas campisalis]MDR5864140.1 A24 family peptidase [Halomonas campisalis]
MLYAICLMLVVCAAAWDLRQRRIPNRLVLAGAAIGLLLQGALAGPSGVLAALYGLLVGLAILMPGYLMGFTGAGDAKLMAAVGTFLGPLGALQAGLASILVGGAIGIGFAASALFNKSSVSPWSRYGLMLKTLSVTGKPLYIAPQEGEVMGRKFPFAVSIAIGTTGWMIWI